MPQCAAPVAAVVNGGFVDLWIWPYCYNFTPGKGEYQSPKPTCYVKRTPILLLCLWLGCHAMAQTPAPAVPVAVSSTGIGEVKVNMTLAKLNALLPQPLQVKRANAADASMDTMTFTYKGYTIVAEFYWRYLGEERNETAVYSLYCSDARLSTKSGIKSGNDKFEVVKKLDGYNLNLYPDWRYEGKADKKRYSVLSLMDGDAGTSLIMYFDNNKLYAFEIRVNEGC
ncbi:MAG: hypothetical protein EAY75_17315 [Bacteroidetes bacterium]|nr:MAG: hypothetical protein EAY75_17315 [Bacteroidota bacterium]